MEHEPIDTAISMENEVKESLKLRPYNEVLSDIRKYWATHHGQDSRSGTTTYRQECARMFMEGTLDPASAEHQTNIKTADRALEAIKAYSDGGRNTANGANAVQTYAI